MSLTLICFAFHTSCNLKDRVRSYILQGGAMEVNGYSLFTLVQLCQRLSVLYLYLKICGIVKIVDVYN